jgi:hypothetical protein
MHRFRALLSSVAVLLYIFAVCPQMHASTQNHVFYLTIGSSIITYNVDPTTGIPTQVGTPLTIAGVPFIGSIVPAPNDHFIYVFLPNGNSYSLSVYDTDTSGVPQTPAVQTLSAQGWQLMIHPDGKYAYVLKTVSGQQGYSSTLYLYHVNPTTGVLTKDPTIQAKYGPDYFYMESLVSFSKSGTRLYDDWSVQFDGENNYNYSYHVVDQTTGQLGADVGTIFAPSNFTGLDETFFTTTYILDLHNDNSGQGSTLNVYRNVKNPKQPYFVCGQAMLNACGNANNYWLSADQKYVFLPDTNDIAIGFIDGTNKRITQTGTIPGNPFLYVSPDDQLIYAVDGTTNVLQVYLFNSTSGVVTAGGSTAINSTNGYGLYPAVRQ